MSLMTDLNVCSELVVLRVPRVELHEECICDSHYIHAFSQTELRHQPVLMLRILLTMRYELTIDVF